MERRTWNRQVAIERGIAPSLELFAGERILGTITAGLWDIGLLGFLLRRQERLVVTTHRIFQYSTNFISANLRCLELAKAETIEAGSQFNVVQLVAGIVLLLGAALLLIGAIFQPSGKLFFVIGSLLSALAGSFALMTAGKKVLQVSGGSLQNSIRLPLARLGVSESKSFVDLISGAVRNLSKATPAAAHQPGRKPAEAPKNSKSGGDVRPQTSPEAQPLAGRSSQEPDGAWNESLNGQDTSYQTSPQAQRKIVNQPRQEPAETMPSTPSGNHDHLDDNTSPPGDGWYRASSRNRRMYTE